MGILASTYAMNESVIDEKEHHTIESVEHEARVDPAQEQLL